MAKLTKSVVDAATPREKQYTVWCSDLKGFGLFVQASGVRTYFVDYRNSSGVRRRITIGRHGTVTAEQARKLAIATLEEAVRGNRGRRHPTLHTFCDGKARSVILLVTAGQ